MSMRSAVCVCGMGSVCARGNGRGSMSIIGVNLITKEVSHINTLNNTHRHTLLLEWLVIENAVQWENWSMSEIHEG